jgi:hypothetical protein
VASQRAPMSPEIAVRAPVITIRLTLRGCRFSTPRDLLRLVDEPVVFDAASLEIAYSLRGLGGCWIRAIKLPLGQPPRDQRRLYELLIRQSVLAPVEGGV